MFWWLVFAADPYETMFSIARRVKDGPSARRFAAAFAVLDPAPDREKISPLSGRRRGCGAGIDVVLFADCEQVADRH